MALLDPERWRILSPLLDHALDLTEPERQSWLEEMRTDSPDLAAELRTLLASDSDAEARAFLVAQPDVTLRGVEIGAYTLESPLGSGGMGTVWLARRTDGRFEGRAAVKLLNLALVTSTGQARFRREGSVLARLTHPGIAHLLDAGVTAGGQPYLVLEYIDGKCIDDYVAQRKLSRDQIIALFLHVLDAVGSAHANLVVHRDLKPSNILVTDDGEVKLLDFGIAKLIDSDSTDRAALTADGLRALTPDFAAPEQVTGTTITTATDVYSLGVLLYLLLSGNHPRPLSTDNVRASFDAEPPRIGSGDLDTILEKALRRDPRERYQTVASFADDLRRFVHHEPVSARRASLPYRTRKLVRRHRAGVALTVVVAASLIGATAFSVRQMGEARRQRDVAIEARRRADAQGEFQSLLMSQVGDKPISMREILDRGRVVLERQYSRDPRFLSAMLVTLSANYAKLGNTEIRGSLLARAESIAVVSGNREQLAEIRCHVADNERTMGEYDRSRLSLASGDSLLRIHPAAEAEATCLEAQAQLDNEVGDGSQSVPAMRRAIAIRDSLGEAGSLDYDGLLATLAGSLDRLGKHREADAQYRRAMFLMDSAGSGETADRAIVEHDFAVSLSDLGETAEAEQLLRDVLTRISRSDPTSHLPSQPLIHYAQTAYYNRHTDSAKKYFAMLATQAVEERNSYWEARALFGLAQTQLMAGDTADARRSLARFRPLGQNPKMRNSDDHIVDAKILDARLALAAGDAATAYVNATDALRGRGYFDGKRSPVFRSALLLASDAARESQRPDTAVRYARDARALATIDSFADRRSAYVGEARLAEGRALLALGDTAAARETLERGVVELRTGAGPAHPLARDAESLLASLKRS